MMELTWFGWTYLVATALATIWLIHQIGKPREPLNAPGVTTQIVVTSLIIWGQIAVGMVHR